MIRKVISTSPCKSNFRTSSQVVSEWMRPNDIVKVNCLGSRPCLFSGSINSSDVCQVCSMVYFFLESFF